MISKLRFFAPCMIACVISSSAMAQSKTVSQQVSATFEVQNTYPDRDKLFSYIGQYSSPSQMPLGLLTDVTIYGAIEDMIRWINTQKLDPAQTKTVENCIAWLYTYLNIENEQEHIAVLNKVSQVECLTNKSIDALLTQLQSATAGNQELIRGLYQLLVPLKASCIAHHE